MKRREIIKMLITVNLVVLQGTNIVHAGKNADVYTANEIRTEQLADAKQDTGILADGSSDKLNSADNIMPEEIEGYDWDSGNEPKASYVDADQEVDIYDEINQKKQVDNNNEIKQQDTLEEGQHERRETDLDEETVSRQEPDISKELEGEQQSEYGGKPENQAVPEEGNMTAPSTESQMETDGSADKSTDKSTDKSADKSTDKSTDESADELADKSADESADKSVDKIANESTDEAVEWDSQQGEVQSDEEAANEMHHDVEEEKFRELSDEAAKPELLEVMVYDENGKIVGSYQYNESQVYDIRQMMNQIQSDGLYTLHVQGVDSDGNPIQHIYAFTVNKAGTSFRYDEERANVYLEDRFTPAIELSNIDEITVLSCMVNGRAVAYEIQGNYLQIDENQIADGKNRITLEVKDGSGNISSMEPWEFYVKNEDAKTNNINTNETKTEKSSFWGKVLARLLFTP